ncbi:MAG: hypothetical protein HYV63_25165 [Candidatus Schekmanbacteria bacterium]|nr:hypothetical protein [Candidatus Schekmanbacteria bacterium]
MTISQIRKLEHAPAAKLKDKKKPLSEFIAQAEQLGRNDRTVRRARLLLARASTATD